MQHTYASASIDLQLDGASRLSKIPRHLHFIGDDHDVDRVKSRARERQKSVSSMSYSSLPDNVQYATDVDLRNCNQRKSTYYTTLC